MKARTIKFNFAINAAAAIVPLAVSLVTVPIYIRHIGDARYGVLSIVWLLLGYFGFLDLGLSRAAANALARLRHASQSERARVLVTVLVINFGMGCFGSLLLFLAGSYLLQHVLAVPDTLKDEVAQAFPWVIVLLPVALVAGVGNGALESRERFALSNVLSVTGICLGQTIPVITALAISPSLTVVIPAAAIVRCTMSLVLLGFVFRSEGPLRLRCFDRGQVSALLRYGGWVSVTGVIGPFLSSLDQFVIGSLLGVAKIPSYSVPMSLVTRSQIFPAALSRTLFPRLSSLNRQDADRLAARALTSVSFGYAAICAPAIIITPVFFSLWINPAFAATAAPVAELLFIGAWVNAMAFVPFSLLQSQGRPDITGKFHTLEVAPFVAILWLLTKRYGIEGAALAWMLRCIVDALLLFVAARIRGHDLARALVPLTILLASVGVAAWSGLNAIGLCVAAGAAGLVALIAALSMAEDLRLAAWKVASIVVRPLGGDRLGRRFAAHR